MWQWTSALLLIAPAAVLVHSLRARDTTDPVPLKTIVGIFLLAGAAPLLFSIIWRLNATRIAIELHAIAFRSDARGEIRKNIGERRPGSGRIVIGDAVTRANASHRFGTLVFRQGALEIELPPPDTRTGLIATGAHGILGAEAIEDGDQICVSGACWTYDADARSFNAGKVRLNIPRRQAEIPGLGWTFALPFAQPVTAGLRTWSLDWMMRQIDSAGPDRRRRSFFAYTNPGRRLRLIVLDREVSLLRNGREVATPTSFLIEDGQRLSFYTLPTESARFAAGGITERRSAVYRAGRRSFQLDLDTPEIHSLSAQQFRTLESTGANGKRVALSMGDAQLVDRSLYFAGLSESVAIQANALLELSRFFPRDFRSSFRLITPRGPVDSAVGRVTWIGTTDLAAIRLDVFRPPLLLLLVGLVLLVLKSIAAWVSELALPQVLMAAAIEMLAGVRLLLAYRVWAMPPHRLEAAQLALVAWMALPWIFLVASLPALRARKAVPALAGLALSALFCLRVVEGPTKWVWLLAHLLPLWRPSAIRIPQWIRTQIERWDTINSGALAVSAVRVILLLFGIKESASFGARLSLSVAHIPAAAILEGIFLWRAWRNVQAEGRLPRQDLIAAIVILVFVWAVPAAVTSDVGLALLNVPVFLLLLLALTRHTETRPMRVWSRALVAVMILFVAGPPMLRLVLPLLSDEEVLLSAASDSNIARFLHFAAPERLQEMATKRGESLAITSAVLQSYISSGVFGRGYGSTEMSPHLGDTALRDFAPAVFIAAEWGLTGTVAALLLYLLFSVIAVPWLPWNHDAARSGPAPSIAAVAAATITVSSVYMILANHELLLLTGKNAYLVGLDSAGDVMEFLVLLLLIAYGAASARTKSVAPTRGASL